MNSNSHTDFLGKKALITGGLGFIGSNLAHRLIKLGAEVTLIDSLIPEYGGNTFNVIDLREQLQINISDVRDVHSIQNLVKKKDFLFNLAGQTSHMDSMEDPFTDLEINARSQLSILETCRKFNPEVKIVFASTRQIYGKPDYLPVDEKHLVKPVDVNGVNKMAGEAYHVLYNNVYGIRSCALRLTNTYGPRMRIKDARQTFLGVWVRLLTEDQSFEVWGGEQLRDFNYVDDVVDALLQAATQDIAFGKTYNLGANEVVSLVKLAEMIVHANGSGNFKVREFPVERKRIDIGDYYADDQLIRKDLGWSPKVPLDVGLKNTLDYYRKFLQHYL